MKIAALFFGLLTACSQARVLMTAKTNYTIVVPQWKVEVSPGGPYVTLNGTIQEVRAELLRLNPNYDSDYPPPVQSKTTVHSSSLKVDGLGEGKGKGKGVFNDATIDGYFCGGRWPLCNAVDIEDGIKYLRGVKGQPTSGPGWGKCGRVSCSYKSAIYWCNDTPKPKTLISFGSIADGAEFVWETCSDAGDFEVSGQVFHNTKWNVIVQRDEHDC